MSRYSITTGLSRDGKVTVHRLVDAVAGVQCSVAPSKGGELASFQVRKGPEEPWVELLYRAEDFDANPGGFLCVLVQARIP